MPDDSSVVLVSNRGPVSFVRAGDAFTTKRGAGGLAGAVDPVARRLGDNAVWVAATNSAADREAVAAGAAGDLQDELGYRVHLLDIEPAIYARYYDEVSNRMLWFATHCLWGEVPMPAFGDAHREAWRDGYLRVNQRFADAVVQITSPSTLVLFQDYHLAVAPRLLRRARPDQKIFHFTHSSFCGPDGFAPLPDQIARGVIEGMLGADLLGFHVPDWVDGFFRCCEKLGAEVDTRRGSVTYDGRETWVRTYPIPVDADELRQRASGRKAQDWAHRFSQSDFLVTRADRTDPSKNIVRGFRAFGLLLDRRDDLRGQARFVACLYPSRQSIPEYRRYVEEIKASVDDVNARHPGAIELFLEDDFERTLGALLAYDVLLVNPLMDGMNLVSKEGAVLNERWGALVLSNKAGSYEELGAFAVEISNATDADATCRALEQALALPPHERRRRALRLRQIAESSKPEDWIEAQIEDLRAISRQGTPVTRPASL